MYCDQNKLLRLQNFNEFVNKVNVKVNFVTIVERDPKAPFSTATTLWCMEERFSLTLDPYLIIFTNPSARAGYDIRSVFKRSLTGFNSEFSFSKTSYLTKAEEPSLPYYLSIAGGRIIGFIPFPRVLVLCEMQPVSSRIWTRVAVFISYDDNHYNTVFLPYNADC